MSLQWWVLHPWWISWRVLFHSNKSILRAIFSVLIIMWLHIILLLSAVEVFLSSKSVHLVQVSNHLYLKSTLAKHYNADCLAMAIFVVRIHRLTVYIPRVLIRSQYISVIIPLPYLKWVIFLHKYMPNLDSSLLHLSSVKQWTWSGIRINRKVLSRNVNMLR